MKEQMKPSGIEWIGDMPVEWDILRFRYAVNIRSEKAKYIPGKDIYVGLENIESSTGKFIKSENEYEEGFYDVFRKSDILFGLLRPYLEKVFFPEHDGFCTGEFLVIKNFVGEKRYLFYFLLSHGFLEIVNASTYGAKMPRASWESIKNLSIPILPFLEQKAISSFLDAQCEKIDGIIADMEQQIEVLKQYKTSLITKTVTKGLDKSVQMKDSGIDWIGRMPAHWEISKVKYLGDMKYGLGEPPVLNDDGIPIIRATNIRSGELFEEDLIYARKKDIPGNKDVVLKKNDIIIVRSGAYAGDVAIIPEKWEGSIAGYDIIFTPKKIDSLFVLFAFLSDYILKYQLLLMRSRAAQPHLNTQDIGNLIILIPPKKEQLKIVMFLTINCEKIDGLISDKQKSIETMKSYKKSLIYEYVTGKKRVRI